MIPYVIEQARPGDNLDDCNIITSYYSSEKEKLNENIIYSIIDNMYEFCSKEYGYGITIISYDDFCEQYWKIKQIKMNDFYIHYVYYFENDWKHWDIEDYKEDIIISYVNKYGVK